MGRPWPTSPPDPETFADLHTFISLGLVVACVPLVSLRERQLDALEQQSARGAHVARRT